MNLSHANLWKVWYRFRLKIFRSLAERVGVNPGDMIPWWLYSLKFVLFPILVLQVFVEKSGPVVYDLRTNSVTIDGVQYSMQMFAYFAEGSGPDMNLFHVVRKEHIGGRICVHVEKIPIVELKRKLLKL